MKNFLIALALSFVSMFASAQTGPLTPVGCSDNRMCATSVTTATGVEPLTLYANTSLVELIFPDGTVYLGVAPVGISVVNFPVYRQPNNDIVIYVTANWSTWTTRGSGSGRGGYQTHTHWALLSGSLLKP